MTKDGTPLTQKQREVLIKMLKGYILFENRSISTRNWGISNDANYHWGNVHGNTIRSILYLMSGQNINIAVKKYSLINPKKVEAMLNSDKNDAVSDTTGC